MPGVQSGIQHGFRHEATMIETTIGEAADDKETVA